jgi:hypothetical protein
MAATSKGPRPLPGPTLRPLKVYAFDPSAGRLLGNSMTIEVEYEPLERGPIGRKLAVIDYDGSLKTWYEPVDLDDPLILIQDGLEPTQSDPRFHQQMVYAVAAETLSHFETALGRHIRWRQGIQRLSLYPHAMAQANAFYSPDAHGIVFGYFRASTTHPGRNLPGQAVFTCLSHDIVAHEMTHAIVDGIRSYFIEPTNIDVPAFHEAFADLAALFRHFTHKEALLDTLQKTGGRLFDLAERPEARISSDSTPQPGDAVSQAQLPADNPLIQLAQQFGEASGMHAGLRSALGKANADDIKVQTEPHARGSILVAAVFDAYLTVYTRRTADLFRIYRAGGGSEHPPDLPGPLAEMLAAEASRTAERFFTTCARALDFCPPVDITFGDFLRALITAHLDLDHDDPDGVRDAFMEGFRLRGIVAQGADFFSEDALCWPQPDGNLPELAGLQFGDLNGLTKEEKDINGKLLRAYAKANAAQLGFNPGQGPIDAPSFHPVFRPRADGRVDVDMVVELVQTQPSASGKGAPAPGVIPMRNGVTLAIAQNPSHRMILSDRRDSRKTSAAHSPAEVERPAPRIRFVIPKLYSPDREQSQQQYAETAGLALCQSDGRINFGLIHGGI